MQVLEQYRSTQVCFKIKTTTGHSTIFYVSCEIPQFTRLKGIANESPKTKWNESIKSTLNANTEHVHECTEHNVECAFVCTLLLNLCVLQALLQEKEIRTHAHARTHTRAHTHTHTHRSGTQRRNTITSIPETRLISSAFQPNQKLLRICHQCGCLCQTKRFFFVACSQQ